MKIERSDLAVLRAHVGKYDRPELRERYRRGDFPRSDRVRDLDKRYRWDIWWAIFHDEREFADRLYGYMNSDHIDTALRRCVASLKSREEAA